jgi:hypothetical protein
MLKTFSRKNADPLEAMKTVEKMARGDRTKRVKASKELRGANEP